MHQPRGDLRAHAHKYRRLVDDHRAPCLAHRGSQRVHIQRREAAQVDHFERDTLARRGFGGGQRCLHRRPVGHDRRVAALARDPCPIQQQRRQRQIQLLACPIARLRLQEDHRVGVGDGGGQQPVGVPRRRGGDDLQPGGVCVVRLRAFGVLLDGADVAAVGDADHQLRVDGAERARVVLGDVAGDLLERRVREGVELHLGHWAKPLHRQAERRGGDGRLRQRRVEDALLAELGLQAVGHAEDPAKPPYVLAEDQHAVVVGQRVMQRQIERLAHGDGAGTHSPASASRPLTNSAFSRSRASGGEAKT